jgi:GTPase SAR1 family protein
LALAANKSDLFQQEQVSEVEGKKYADEIGVIFQVTSACTGVGINELFYNIGCKILNHDGDKNELEQPEQRQTIQIKKSKIKEDDKIAKSRCC